MMKKLENPIQQVLAAERAAEAEIAAAREAAEAAVTAARKRVPTIVHSNETRTQRAVERYEKQQSKMLKTKTRALRQESEAKLTDEQTLLDEHFDHIVEEIFNDVWPQDDPR
jgi:vacuolar-type H+-ATPase subunit H